MFKILINLFVVLSVTPFAAQALPLAPANRAAVQLSPLFTAQYNFEGIVALSNCSGSLIRLENSKDTDKALILTNGHSYEGGFIDPGTYLIHQPSSRSFAVLDPQADRLGSVHATEVVYGTMTQTDVTIYKLRETYADILNKFKVHPLTLSSQHPTSGQNIEVISGYWERGYSCQIETFVNELKEGDWQWQDSIRYSRPGCEVIGGTSGSPIVLAGTRTVVGINNTGNEDGEKCTVNNPCEIDKSGKIFYQQGYSYGQETYWIYSCVDSNNEINMSTPGCLLPH